MNFDEKITRANTHSMKWDMMGAICENSSPDYLPMWVADMDFRPPQSVQKTVEEMAEHGIYGYFGDDKAYLDAIRWWMKNRHDWDVDPAHILTVHGLVNAVGLVIDTFTKVGDGVVLMTPVYHAFARIIKASERSLLECPLALVEGRYEMDFEAWDHMMTGNEKMLILCSPHNPGGRVWSKAELRGVAEFCEKHDLILISDEIHHDLIFPGHKHHIMETACPDIAPRLIMLTAASKTFNIAGSHTGNIIVKDNNLRNRLQRRLASLGISPNAFGMRMIEAAYSQSGVDWLTQLIPYIDQNRKIFDDAIHKMPGLRSMNLEATYLAWVDFRNTGLSSPEVKQRIEKEAKICVIPGESFGKGGEEFIRFNLAMPRFYIHEAVERLQQAFQDLQ